MAPFCNTGIIIIMQEKTVLRVNLSVQAVEINGFETHFIFRAIFENLT